VIEHVERRRRRTAALFAGAAVAVAAVSFGAAAGARESAPDRAASTDPDRWVSCAAQAPKPAPNTVIDMMDLPRLPAEFVPASVVICRGEGNPKGAAVGNEFRGTDIAALVAALRLPDIPRAAGRDVSCTLEAINWPWMALVDADGRFVRPSPPRTPCGKPRAEVYEAIRALKLTRVDSRVYDAHLAPEPAAARCEATWEDRVWTDSRRGARPGPAGQPLAGAAAVGLCEYHVSAGERGRTFPTGDFARGRVLPQPRRDLIEDALSATGPAEPCTGPASRFAVLMLQGGGYGEVLVELDGCHRVLSYPGRGKDPVVSQGGPELTRLLDGS
jgi:hypothetical protein